MRLRRRLGSGRRDFERHRGAASIDDDKWGTPASVDAMMRAYPSVERRHIVPSQRGLARIGHMGFFRPSSSALWTEVVDWFNSK